LIFKWLIVFLQSKNKTLYHETNAEVPSTLAAVVKFLGGCHGHDSDENHRSHQEPA